MTLDENRIVRLARCGIRRPCARRPSQNGYEAKVSIAPSAAAREFCDTLGASLSKCDMNLDHAACLDRMKTFGDPTLADATSCTAKSCSAIAPCVDARL